MPEYDIVVEYCFKDGNENDLILTIHGKKEEEGEITCILRGRP